MNGSLDLHPIEGLHLSYIEESVQAKNCFYRLSVGVILKGHKRLMIGSDEYRYGPGSAIVTSIDMPTSYELMNVSKEEPFVSLSIPLNTATLAELIQDDDATSQAKNVFSVEPSSEELMKDFYRLLSLLEKPAQIPLRAPLIIRDIHCLALSGAGGDCLRALYAPDAARKRIRQAIRWLRDNYRSEVSIERLAEVASMAPSIFHRHFREFTSLTPLQYPKRLRLYEARQLLLKGGTDANSAPPMPWATRARRSFPATTNGSSANRPDDTSRESSPEFRMPSSKPPTEKDFDHVCSSTQTFRIIRRPAPCRSPFCRPALHRKTGELRRGWHRRSGKDRLRSLSSHRR